MMALPRVTLVDSLCGDALRTRGSPAPDGAGMMLMEMIENKREQSG